MPHLTALLPYVSLPRTVRALLAGWAIAAGLAFGPAQAQTPARPAVEAAPQAVPGVWDPRRRPDRPDLSRLTGIRVLTENDYPPFNFTGPDRQPARFNVHLAPPLCGGIKVTLTTPKRPFET